MAERVAIVGGGPAGMALALALHRHGIGAEIFDARARGAATGDKRILALSWGARQILERLGAWQGIPATAIETIHVSQRGRLGRTVIRAGDEAVPALGYVLAASDLAAALDAAVAAAGISYREHHRIAAAAAQSPAAAAAGFALTAWAEGSVAEADAVVRDYGQHAVLCTAATREPHRHVAWERFTPEGPVALLPFGNEYAVVLTCPAAAAGHYAALDDAAFIAVLRERFGARLTFSAAGPRVAYALGLRYRAQVVGERQVWIGNAAQTLHPVAGQGFNLALRDIWDLARTLADAPDPGDAATLARYAAARRFDRRGAIGFTDALVRTFSNDFAPLAHLRGAGLLALDLLPPVRSFVARRMMFGARAW